VHVLDASNPDWPRQQVAVETQLHDLELDAKPRLLVFNKTDVSCHPEVLAEGEPRRTREAIRISARTGFGLDALRNAIAQCA
jgi:GTP-binding protein HflX